MSVMQRNTDMSESLLRSQPPKDQYGEPMQAGRAYIIGKTRSLCFEDPNDGNLYQQAVDKIGTALPNSRPVHVLMMPAGNYTVYRLED